MNTRRKYEETCRRLDGLQKISVPAREHETINPRHRPFLILSPRELAVDVTG